VEQTVSIKNKEAVAPYSKAASIFVKTLMLKKEVKYDKLSEMLAREGVQLSSSNLRNKVSGNALSSGLMLLIVRILSDEERINISIDKVT
jgi:hypothetical protein